MLDALNMLKLPLNQPLGLQRILNIELDFTYLNVKSNSIFKITKDNNNVRPLFEKRISILL